VPSGRQVCHRPSGGEHAALVADLDRAAQVRRNDAVGAAQLGRGTVGAEDHPPDAGVTGQPAGPGRGDHRPEAGLRGGRVRADLRPERRRPVSRTP
jgi:hypothetical protein